MYTQYHVSTYSDDEPLYKRIVYYLMLFLIGFIPGLVTGYLIGL